MSLDEQDLRQQLGRVMEVVTPSPAPVGPTVRQGRGIRVRRRAGVAAGLAAVVGVAVAVPSLLHAAAQAPVSPTPPSVTVNPAGAEAKDGVIGSGRINGQRWRLVAQPPGTDGVPKGTMCFLVTGAGMNGQECLPSIAGSGGAPPAFASIGGGRAQAQYGVVPPAVTRVTVTLADGTVLVLHPTEAFGQHYVAFATPLPLAISRAVAYAGRSEISYTVPFPSATGNVFTFWLKAGQRGLPRASYRIGSGNVDGNAWSETVHVGPWGYCFTGGQSNCFGTQVRSFDIRDGLLSASGLRTTGYVIGTAALPVSRVRVILSGGPSVTVRVVNAEGLRFFAFAIPRGTKLVRVVYLAASGRQGASEPVSQIYSGG
jgi:hypothetical protein